MGAGGGGVGVSSTDLPCLPRPICANRLFRMTSFQYLGGRGVGESGFEGRGANQTMAGAQGWRDGGPASLRACKAVAAAPSWNVRHTARGAGR